MNKIGVISLGCDKNRVDTENMLAFLKNDGYVFTGNPKDANIIIINTCAFIDSAKKEAIDTILEMSEYKNDNCKCLVVTGCLPQRYMNEIKEELSEVDIFLGTCNYRDLPNLLKQYRGESIALENDKDKRDFSMDRVLTTPYHYAYLKIAEGCDNKCTYCAIPAIRGKYTSRPKEDIVAEAKRLISDYGVKELNIVAQDITRYGIDLYGKYSLIELIDELSGLEISWIRLLYCYPELVTDELIDYISENPKVTKYIDIPMQHAASSILKRMNRRVRKEDLITLVKKLKNAKNPISIRTTFIIGFPGETEEDFKELYDFVKESEFDKCGFFAYSCEDGTPASRLPNMIDEETKQKRVEIMYELQESIMLTKAKSYIGKEFTVIYEDIDYEEQRFIGRLSQDAPEIDRVVYFNADYPIEIGNFYKVKITDNEGIDLIGELK